MFTILTVFKGHEDWLERTELEKEAPLVEVKSV